MKKFDVIHIHDARCLQCAITANYAKLFDVPVVFQPHGSFRSILPSGKLRKLSRLFVDKLYAEKVFGISTKIVALSWVEAEQYRRMGVPDEKIAVIPNGIDLSEYANLPPKGSFKSSLD
jgi:glycosyltransferase involved in cell wall biosynthesis